MTERAPAAGNRVTLHLAAVLCDLFPGSERIVRVEAQSVGEAIEALDRLWPGMGDRIADSRPAIRPHINVFADGERLAYRDPIPGGAEVFILTAISGG